MHKPSFLLLLLLLLAAPARADGPRPWLGILIEKGARGVRVTQVMPESPCAAADVHPGDEVLTLGESKVGVPKELIEAVQRQPVGKRVQLMVVSPQGKERTVPVVLGPRPKLEDIQKRGLVGQAAPDFAPRVLSGAPMASLKALAGQVVLLDFFASWCGPCMLALPEIEALHRRLGKRGLRVVGLSTETPETIGRVVREHGLTYTVGMDPDEQASRLYRVFALPTLVVVDRKGLVRTVALNEVAEATRLIEEALRAGEVP